MECTTKHLNPISQLMEDKPKKQFNTNEQAIAHAKYVNGLPNRINKVVPYKCPVCFKFHVGRNGKPLTEKYVAKITKPKVFQGFKIVGQIKL